MKLYLYKLVENESWVASRNQTQYILLFSLVVYWPSHFKFHIFWKIMLDKFTTKPVILTYIFENGELVKTLERYIKTVGK